MERKETLIPKFKQKEEDLGVKIVIPSTQT